MKYIDKQKFDWDCAVVAVMNALIYKGKKPNYRKIRSLLKTDPSGTEDDSIFTGLLDLGFERVVLVLNGKHTYKGPALLAYDDDYGDSHIAFFNNNKGYNTFLKTGKPNNLYYVVKL